jgi:MFS family permease
MQSITPEPEGRVRGAANETFRSLRIRNFRLFFGGQIVSQAGNWMTLITQTLLVLHLTHNGVAVGLMTAAQFLPVLLFGAWAGVIADRSDKRKLLIGIQAFAMVQSFALAALAFMDQPPLAAFYLLAIAGGFATAFDNPARRSFVVEMVPEEYVQNAVSLNSALMMGARMVGPALAGVVIEVAGFGWSFAIDGFSYIAVIAAYWLMRSSELRRAPVTPRGKGQVRAGLHYVRATPDLWIPLVMVAIVGTFAFNFQVVFPLFVTRTFGGTATDFTLLFTTLSFGSLIGALATARRYSVSVRQVIVASTAFGAAMLVFAGAPTLAIAFPLAVLVGATSMTFMTSATAIVQLRAEPQMRGRVLALQSMVFLGSTPIGGPILGAVCDEWGPRAGVVVGAVAAFAAAAWGAVAVRRGLRASRAQPPPPARPARMPSFRAPDPAPPG